METNHLLDRLINLDTDQYYQDYKDVQSATRKMTPTDRQLWILSHFIKNGYREHRKYRLKQGNLSPLVSTASSTASSTSGPSATPVHSHPHSHTHSHSHTKKLSSVTLSPQSSGSNLTVKHIKTRQIESDTDGNESASEAEDDISIQQLIKQFRTHHGHCDGGVRDRTDTPVTQDKGVFWDINPKTALY
jgi:hypothetical protein|uniref:Uncharacterized protein n=1 Tax=viral metagenome TaxID=1070528 RepID=A0A6C0BJT0_9ZZZZ